MAGRKNKRFNSIKKNHLWVWIVVFAVMLIAACFAMTFFLTSLLQYGISSKVSDEFDHISDMAAIYERGLLSDTNTTELMDGLGRDYMITDEGGEIVYSHGGNTCGDYTGSVSGHEIYLDKELGVIAAGENGTLNIDYLTVMRNFKKYMSDAENREDAEDPELDEINNMESFEEGLRLVKLPFWAGISLDGGGKFIAKACLTANLKDVIVVLVSIGIIGLLVFFIFAAMLINIISSIVRSRKTLNVFFSDVVTKGHNQMYFIIKGEEMLRKRYSYSVRYAVVDLFFVNYRNFCVCHSVEEGEKVMCEIYNTINGKLGKREICAHYASSDLALILKCENDDELKVRLNDMISELKKINEEHSFAFHAGVAVIEPDGTVDKNGNEVHRRNLDIEEVFNHACTARETLELSDESGIAFFDDKLVEDQKWIDTVQEHQKSALENEEFVVYYQPKYDPRTDELKGAEALIRWQSPEFGFVPPGRIIPIFEKNGFITEIDHYMIQHVARDQKRWLDAGFRCVPVSVNVSRAHFIESTLAEQIRDMIDAAGTPHDLIEIELTESAFFDDKKAMISTIMKLKEYGFAVSMDDFGSGYSSLNSLKDMPLDVLKLDAEFFRGENGEGRGEIVVSEAIKLAKSLNMRTVAEGVEIREQVDFLASQGCDMIQGYFYAKPMPGEDFETRMKDRVRPKEDIMQDMQ